jgi:hypothetical protein
MIFKKAAMLILSFSVLHCLTESRIPMSSQVQEAYLQAFYYQLLHEAGQNKNYQPTEADQQKIQKAVKFMREFKKTIGLIFPGNESKYIRIICFIPRFLYAVVKWTFVLCFNDISKKYTDDITSLAIGIIILPIVFLVHLFYSVLCSFLLLICDCCLFFYFLLIG